jgi:hypothetical protein
MSVAAEIWLDDPPPESGVRLRRAPVAPAPARPADLDFSRVVVEAFAEASVEAFRLLSVLSPLQGSWWIPRLGQLGSIALTVLGWCREDPATKLDRRTLGRRWPELVPDAAALDRLAGLMVDWICR